MRSTYVTTVARTQPEIPDRSTSQSAIYGSLSREAQRYVDSVTTMGFDLSDVARTVSRLGIDDKLVRSFQCSARC